MVVPNGATILFSINRICVLFEQFRLFIAGELKSIEMEQKRLPIGYWIKQADVLLTNGINTIHNTQGIDRTGWQILHTIQGVPNIVMEQLVSLMEPFADPAAMEKTLEQLIAKGWVTSGDGKLFLTISGEAFHEHCLQQQTAFRQRSMQHITPGDYETTLNTLRQLVQNLS